jgi:anti-sigma B factor antagonist
MKIRERTVGDVRILDCSGKITLGEGTMSVRNAIRDVLQSGGKSIVLNLADISYVDSTGVGALMNAYTTVVNAGGRLMLLNLTKRLQELLVVTKLLTVFEVLDNENSIRLRFGSWD